MAGEIAVGRRGRRDDGRGIGQVALEAGHEVVLYDVDELARERGVQRIRDGLARRAAKLDLDADAVDDWVDGRLADVRHAHTLEALGAEAGLGSSSRRRRSSSSSSRTCSGRSTRRRSPT